MPLLQTPATPPVPGSHQHPLRKPPCPPRFSYPRFSSTLFSAFPFFCLFCSYHALSLELQRTQSYTSARLNVSQHLAEYFSRSLRPKWLFKNSSCFYSSFLLLKHSQTHCYALVCAPISSLSATYCPQTSSERWPRMGKPSQTLYTSRVPLSCPRTHLLTHARTGRYYTIMHMHTCW